MPFTLSSRLLKLIPLVLLATLAIHSSVATPAYAQNTKANPKVQPAAPSSDPTCDIVNQVLNGCGKTFCDPKTQTCDTALGPISYNVFKAGDDNFITQVLTLAVGIGGGIALLLMLYGFFTITTSAGIPDKIKLGQETISSAALGLVFIILSTVLMNFIGLNVLGIPGLK